MCLQKDIIFPDVYWMTPSVLAVQVDDIITAIGFLVFDVFYNLMMTFPVAKQLILYYPNIFLN